jgi:hypothetical protein
MKEGHSQSMDLHSPEALLPQPAAACRSLLQGGVRAGQRHWATGPALTGVIDQGRGSKVGLRLEAITKWCTVHPGSRLPGVNDQMTSYYAKSCTANRERFFGSAILHT